MTWRAIYNASDGRLLSVGTKWTEPPRPGTDFKEYVDKPDGIENMWDGSIKDFIPRPPKVLIDRFDDLLSDPDFAQGHAQIPPPFRPGLESAIKNILGTERFRNVAGSVEIGR